MRRPRHDIKVNHERWLVSYADFVTLLFAFFVVMYSISQVNEAKYKELSSTLEAVFSTEAKSLDPIQIGQPVKSQTPSIVNGEARGDDQGAGSFSKIAELPQLESQLESEFADLIEDELVTLDSNELWIKMELKSSILFASGGTEASEAARAVFEDVATLLKGFDNIIQVEGFTDNQAISSQRFPSNWELSAARASSIVKLLAEFGVRPQRMAAVGYGEYQPVADNASAEGRANNRRVVLMIARQAAERLPMPVTDAVDITRQGNRSTDISRSTVTRLQDRAVAINEMKQLARESLLQELQAEALAQAALSNGDGGSDNSDETALQPQILDSGEIRYSAEPQ